MRCKPFHAAPEQLIEGKKKRKKETNNGNTDTTFTVISVISSNYNSPSESYAHDAFFGLYTLYIALV